MKISRFAIPFTIMFLGIGVLSQADSQTPPSPQASQLMSSASQLRKLGQPGLQQFLTKNNLQTQSALTSPPTPEVRAALDSLCQQRDCYASKLYWYTDLEQAKAAAKVSGKPILSLRLLGRLDEDLSCANSRFFRVALYPNARIAKLLREKYILHWQSVRPAPKVTIDFGDGRKLERTITGNSIHYILDSSGRPIDAIPGLYGPQAFFQQLIKGEAAVKGYSQASASGKEAFLRQYHQQRLNSLENQWRADLSKLGIRTQPGFVESQGDNVQPPSANVAANVAVSKSMVERPMLSRIGRQGNPSITDERNWQRIAGLYTADAKLDENSIAAIAHKKLVNTKQSSSNLSNTIRSFEAVMALDTVRNEYMLHRQIHQWFIQGNQTSSVDRLNEKVYADLFLTPSSDPWLGLAPDDAYSAIDNDGVR
jgi:hypothetical protein